MAREGLVGKALGAASGRACCSGSRASAACRCSPGSSVTTFTPLAAQFAAQAFAVADHRGLAGAVGAVAGQAADAGHAGDAHQRAAAALRASPAMKGWKVAAMPSDVGLVGRRASPRDRRRTAVSMPTLMPALAITTSGRPWAAMQAWPAAIDGCDVAHVGARRRRSVALAAALRLQPRPATSAPRRATSAEPIAGAVEAQRQRLADAAGSAGDEDQRGGHGAARVRQGARGGVEHGAHAALELRRTRARLSYSMPSAAHLGARRAHRHRQVRAHAARCSGRRAGTRCGTRSRRRVPRRLAHAPAAPPSSCTSLPSPLASARTRAWPGSRGRRARCARMRALSISSVSVSGKWRSASPSICTRSAPSAPKRCTVKFVHRVVGLVARRRLRRAGLRPSACS